MLLFLASLVIGAMVGEAVALAAVLLYRFMRTRLLRMEAALAADLLFLIEISGLAAGVVTVLLFVMPGFIAWEPGDSSEAVPVWLALASALVLGVIARAIFRTLRELRNEVHARPDVPLIAVLGLFQPRLICTDSARALLSEEELASVLLHENVHIARSDNLRELICRFSSRLLPAGSVFKDIRTQRLRMSECAADAVAAKDEVTALSLASALVRLARSTPHRANCQHAYISTAVPNPRESVIADRVERLLHFQEYRNARSAQIFGTALLASIVVGVLVLAFSPVVQTICYRSLEKMLTL